MDKRKDDRRVVFRRIGGRIVPIAIGAGIAVEASRRRTISIGSGVKITERRSIFSNKTTIKAKKKV